MRGARTAYRIVEIKDGKPHTLFHGLDGSRKLPLHRWVRAKTNKKVRDGGGDNWYTPGFNVLLGRQLCIDYLTRFNRGKTRRELWVIPVFVAGKIRAKPTASRNPVMLAEFINVPWPPENPYVQPK